MEDVKVCRICLNMDIKMHDLHSYPLESYFASVLIDSKPWFTTQMPPYACYECAALVKKFYFFRQKCLRTQEILCEIIDDCGKITHAAIRENKRESLLVISNLTHIDIKEENDIDCLNIEPGFTVEIIKKEDHDNDDIPDNTIPSPSQSSDDEHTEKNDKEKIKDVDMEKLDFTVKLNINVELEDPELAPATENESVSVPPPKKTRMAQPKKRSRTKKTGMTVGKKKVPKVAKEDGPCSDDKTQMEDITVVTLSLEEQIEEINKRKQSSNYLNCPYQCHLCYKGFNNTQAWKHHVTKHSPIIGDIECTICKYRFKTKRNLQRHVLNHGKKYVCKLCPYNSSNITTVKQHQGSHKGITHKCNYCDEVFTVRTTYVSHMRIKHPSENICGLCGYSFYSKQGLLVHKNMVHKDILIKVEENKDEGLYCAECDVRFISTEAFKRHMVMSVKHTESTDTINGCRVCGAKFSGPEKLRLHHRKEHPEKQPKNYRVNKWPAKCEHCSEEMPSTRAYLKHFRLVHPEENYPLQKKCVCDICGKLFMCNALLVMHKRTHFGERPYKCSQCDTACFTGFDLRVHQQKHSDIRPFPCTVCTKAFKRKEALERHLKIHSGDNLYKCEICGVAFNKPCTRTLHVRTEHARAPAPARARRMRKPAGCV